MFYRHILRTFTNPRIRCLNNGFRNKYNNFGSPASLSTSIKALKDEKVKVTFVLHDGKRLQADANVGDSILDVIVNNDLNIEGYGACEGTLTCSTCHVILKQEDYDRLPKKMCDEERDMLDLAYGLTDTSRLGCQIIMTKELDGLEVKFPETINDARS